MSYLFTNIFFITKQEIMDVEHLWFSSRPAEVLGRHSSHGTNPEENMVQTLADMADKRLYKLVKWCKSLPLFKNILVRNCFQI